MNGSIANPVFSFAFGAAPLKDRLDFSGTYVLGSGSNGTHLPGEAVIFSFDGGKFVQAIPSGSFTAISGGFKFIAPTTVSGITSMIWKNDGTFSVAVRNADFTGSDPTKFGAIVVTVGDDVFASVPNSLPVAAIAGAASSGVGSLMTLDGSQSSDFGGGVGSLTYSWAIVSQPLGSSVSLSSTNQATTSFTPLVSGAYVLRLVNNDGIADGVPALFTVSVTGGTAPPPPPPTSDNGLIALSSDLNSYPVGQSATIHLHVNVPDGNSFRRYAFLATYDDAPVSLTTVKDQVDYTFMTPAFTDTALHTFKIVQYTETTDFANDIVKAIANLNADILSAQKALQYETSPAVIAQLQAQILFDQQQIAIDQQKLAENRTQVAGPAVLVVGAQ